MRFLKSIKWGTLWVGRGRIPEEWEGQESIGSPPPLAKSADKFGLSVEKKFCVEMTDNFFFIIFTRELTNFLKTLINLISDYLIRINYGDEFFQFQFTRLKIITGSTMSQIEV